MKNSTQTKNETAYKLYNNFRSNYIILFVGKNARDKDLPKEICSLPWSCVITSRTDEAFGGMFYNESRSPKQYGPYEKIPSRPLDRFRLPVLRIFGVDGHEKSESQEEESIFDFSETKRDEKITKTLGLIPPLLDCLNQMIVIGYDPGDESDVPVKKFASLFEKSIPPGNIQFFGMNYENAVSKNLWKWAKQERQSFAWHEESLANIFCSFIKSQKDLEKDSPLSGEAENLTFYKNKVPKIIAESKARKIRGFLTLLTDQTLYAVQPHGRIQLMEWFANFLTLSSESPQWYGYLPNSTFYMKRDFEDQLVSTTRDMLLGCKEDKRNKPIILQGDTGSSKSITLGALAYKIYSENINPVIFINGKNLLFLIGSDEFEALESLMQEIGDSDERILIIWDCSSYRELFHIALRLKKQLEDRGRRFVLVCSAYQMPAGDEEDEELNGGSKSNRKNAFKIIPSNRELSEKDCSLFYSQLRLFIDDERLSSLRDSLMEERDIFNLYYNAISLLRPRLEEGVRREHKIISKYIKKQLDKITPKTNVNYSKFDLMKMLGLEDLEETEDEEEKEDEDGFNFHGFNICLAMFSRFGLETPSSLAMRLLDDKKKIINDQVYYSTNHRELFKIVTTEVPWIHYGESPDWNDFTFKFRTVRDAELFLDRNNIEGHIQVEALCDILSVYGDRAYSDSMAEENMLNLVRLMGPNSIHPDFQKGKHLFYEVIPLYDSVIEKLRWLRETYAYIDASMGFFALEINLLREYYGTAWDNFKRRIRNSDIKAWVENKEHYNEGTYTERLRKLSETIKLADNKIEDLTERAKSQHQRHDKKLFADCKRLLIVELTLCNISIEDIYNEYVEYCAHEKIKPKPELNPDRFTLPYKEIYNQLIWAINHAPINGYTYNALFRRFNQEYDRTDLSNEIKLQYLSEMNMVIDNLETDYYEEILNNGTCGRNGNDEIGKNIAGIKSYGRKHPISIDAIKKGNPNDPYIGLFNRMLESNNPATIVFVCQQELKMAQIDRNTAGPASKLNEKQIKTCRKIRDFILEEAHYKCVEMNANALRLLLQVTWMYYENYPLNSKKECQLTHMGRDQWREILSICETYDSRMIQNKPPIVVLAYALAIIQVHGDYEEAMKKLKTLSDNMFDTQRRMWVPYMICDPNGEPEPFKGTVFSIEENSNNRRGWIKMHGIPFQTGVRTHCSNLNEKAMPDKNTILGDLELGIGYTGFSVYNAKGRKRKDAADNG
jgi:hypothetical protein